MRIARVLLAALPLAGLPSCGGPVPPAARSAGGEKRIVAVAPAAAEIVDALGATRQIVGVGDFVSWPPSVTRLPRVGAYDAPSIEGILSLHTDLLISTLSRAASPTHRRLESLGVEVLELDTSTFDGVFASIRAVGRAIGREAVAAQRIERMETELDAIEKRAAGLPRPRVLFVVGRDPLYVAGPGSHVDEMIRRAGGTNVAADAATSYARVSLESVLERLPELIVDTSDNRPDAPRGQLSGSWSQWPFLPAVRDGRVWWIDPTRLVIPGVRLPEMTRLMAQLIHPEAFGTPELDGHASAP
ncbi:MAG TPA: helical backbone metal receptor [Candidatus Polarisedimenticolaceae bacterium]|nr:helical backbone metal receptor [Candidatus Polarisedimenticolaceae bacterium]